MHIYNHEYGPNKVNMGENDVSFKKGIPLYIAGIASIATGLFLLSAYSVSFLYNTLTTIIAFIAAGLILYLVWLTHMGMDSKEFDNGGGGGKGIFLDKPI
jgi:hypothetical protein